MMADTKGIQPDEDVEVAVGGVKTRPAAAATTRHRDRKPLTVLVDYVGGYAAPASVSTAPDLEPAMERRRARASERFGTRLRPHEIAPLVADPKDSDAQVMLRSGLNLVDAKVWAEGAIFAKRVAAGQIVVLNALPRSTEAIIDLCERTVCLDALAELRQHEHGRRGGENGEHARDEVLEAIDHRIATVTRRAKGPSSGPRLGALQVERRHRRARAS